MVSSAWAQIGPAEDRPELCGANCNGERSRQWRAESSERRGPDLWAKRQQEELKQSLRRNRTDREPTRHMQRAAGRHTASGHNEGLLIEPLNGRRAHDGGGRTDHPARVISGVLVPYACSSSSSSRRRRFWARVGGNESLR